MKPNKENKCPKCESEAWHIQRTTSVQDQLHMGWILAHNRLTTFVCASCGYTERYLLNEEARRKVAAAWPLAGQLTEEDRKTLEKKMDMTQLMIVLLGLVIGAIVTFIK